MCSANSSVLSDTPFDFPAIVWHFSPIMLYLRPIMRFIHTLLYHILFALWWLFSALPLALHYLGADILYFIVRYVVRYRRDVVRRNLQECFPELSRHKRNMIERRFYLFFCDYIVESIKFFSISKRELRYRMEFRGLERINESLANGRSCAVFLGHYGNWEWISSLPLWVDPNVGRCLQLYHPLSNKAIDRLMGYVRERMGSTNIKMKESIRHIARYKKEGVPVVVGFIADQAPKWDNINYWLPFFNHDAPVLTGAERIARKMDMDCYFLHVQRKRRGRYVAEFQLMTDAPQQKPENWVTEEYTRRMEANIREQPSYWLWTHERFKRTRQGYIDRLRKLGRSDSFDTEKFFDHEHPQGISIADWIKECAAKASAENRQ